MKKNLTIILLSLAVAVLLYFLLSDTKQPDSHKFEYEQAQADLKEVREQRNEGLKKLDSLERDAKRRDTAEAYLIHERAFYRREGDRSAAIVVKYAREIKALKGDTSDHDRKCDSLANEALNFAWLYNQYKDYSDSLTAIVDSNKVNYQLALSEQKRLYGELYSKYEQLYRLYDNLFKDYTGARKSLKREKLKTKVAALLALIGGGAAVLK